MYITNIDTNPAGIFSGKLVVSMRPIPSSQIPQAVTITEKVPQVHGSPVHIGNPSAIGIKDISIPDFGGAAQSGKGNFLFFGHVALLPKRWNS